jgi:eukaryotic-like serine/threonine-protein kinase
VTGLSPPTNEPLLVDRYFLFREIAAGGMASIHLARLLGPVGFGRTVAIKRLHPQYAKEREFVTMFVDEARIVTSIRHPNVVPVLDVVALPGHLFIVMEYVHGEALHRLASATITAKTPIPPAIISAIGINMLEGLHAAHEALGPGGKPLDVIHRDVSPQNVLVGIDGHARVLDFGVAKATSQLHETTTGSTKGKLKYMAPEQIDGLAIDRRVDIWSASVVLWELLAQNRLFKGDNDGLVIRRVLEMRIPTPSSVSAAPPAFDDIIMKGLSRAAADRYPNARAMALALEAACPPASPRDVTEWVELYAGPSLREREKILQELEATANTGLPSVRTQLEVLADHATRPQAAPAPTDSKPPAGVAKDDLTAPVGGRPADSSASTDAFVGASDADASLVFPAALSPRRSSFPAPAPPAREREKEASGKRRLPLAVTVGAGVILGAAAVIAGMAYTTKSPDPAKDDPRAMPTVSVTTASGSLAPSTESASPPASRSATTAPPPPVVSGKPTPTGRKPVRSDPRTDPDGVRLDHRK